MCGRSLERVCRSSRRLRIARVAAASQSSRAGAAPPRETRRSARRRTPDRRPHFRGARRARGLSRALSAFTPLTLKLDRRLARAARIPRPTMPATILIADDDRGQPKAAPSPARAGRPRGSDRGETGARLSSSSREETCDVVLLDILMPVLDGISVLERAEGDAGCGVRPGDHDLGRRRHRERRPLHRDRAQTTT